MSKSIMELISMEGLTRPPADFLTPQTPEAGAPAWYKFQNKEASDTGKDSDVTEIFIYEQIGGWFGMTAVDFIEELKAVESSKIDLHLNSPGGEVFDAVAIYNSLVSHPAEVTVYVDGLAASAASFIAQAGDTVIMQKASTMMIHDASGLAWGNADDMVKTANILNKISNNIASIYAERTGGTVDEWRAFMQEEIWYTATEAVTAGLADKVSTKVVKDPKSAENKFNLAVFNFAYKSREEAPSPAEIQRKVKSMGTRTVNNQSTNSEAPASPDGVEEEEAVVPETPPVETPAEGTPVAPPVQTPAEGATAPANAASGRVILNGASSGIIDMAAIQNHINGLEQFRKETLEAGRRSFVQNLATQNKIGAPQVTQLDVFAQGLSDEQYEAWTKTWDVAVALPMLGNHAEGSTNHNGDTTASDTAAADRVSVLVATVRQHKLSGMKNEQIEKTGSFKELKQLNPTYIL